MVKAEITVGTCYGDAVIPVEVFGMGPRPETVWVRALNGLEPFTRNSHGGPCQDSTSIVLISHLRDVRIENELGQERLEEPVQENAMEVRHPTPDQRIPADWFFQSACTVCARPPEGGEA